MNGYQDVGHVTAPKCKQVEIHVAFEIGVWSMVQDVVAVDMYSTWKNINEGSGNKVLSCLDTHNITVTQ